MTDVNKRLDVGDFWFAFAHFFLDLMLDWVPRANLDQAPVIIAHHNIRRLAYRFLFHLRGNGAATRLHGSKAIRCLALPIISADIITPFWLPHPHAITGLPAYSKTFERQCPSHDTHDVTGCQCLRCYKTRLLVTRVISSLLISRMWSPETRLKNSGRLSAEHQPIDTFEVIESVVSVNRWFKSLIPPCGVSPPDKK